MCSFSVDITTIFSAHSKIKLPFNIQAQDMPVVSRHGWIWTGVLGGSNGADIIGSHSRVIMWPKRLAGVKTNIFFNQECLFCPLC
jgi:hypothetical protein